MCQLKYTRTGHVHSESSLWSVCSFHRYILSEPRPPLPSPPQAGARTRGPAGAPCCAQAEEGARDGPGGVFLLRRRGCGWGRSGDGRREMRHAGRGGFPLPLSESRSQVEANGPGELSAHWHFGLPVGAGRGAAGRSGPLTPLRVEGPCLSETSALALLAVPEEKAVEQRCQRGGYSGSVAMPP